MTPEIESGELDRDVVLARIAGELAALRDNGRPLEAVVFAFVYEDEEIAEIMGAGEIVELLELALDTFENPDRAELAP